MLLDFPGAKLRPAVAQSPTNGFGSIHFGIGTDGNEFSAIAIAKGGDASAIEINFRRGTRFGMDQLDIVQTTVVGKGTRFHGAGGFGRTTGHAPRFQPLGTRCHLLTMTTVKQGRARHTRVAAGGSRHHKGGGTRAPQAQEIQGCSG